MGYIIYTCTPTKVWYSIHVKGRRASQQSAMFCDNFAAGKGEGFSRKRREGNVGERLGSTRASRVVAGATAGHILAS
jgi:hypothetical protein